MVDCTAWHQSDGRLYRMASIRPAWQSGKLDDGFQIMRCAGDKEVVAEYNWTAMNFPFVNYGRENIDTSLLTKSRNLRTGGYGLMQLHKQNWLPNPNKWLHKSLRGNTCYQSQATQQAVSGKS